MIAKHVLTLTIAKENKCTFVSVCKWVFYQQKKNIYVYKSYVQIIWLVGFCIASHLSTLFPEINECASDPCMHDGTCTDQLNAYVCHCPSGFTSTNCEIGWWFFYTSFLSVNVLVYRSKLQQNVFSLY